VNVSQCCPSRASIFTGLYAHHSGVGSNKDPLDGTTPIRIEFPRVLQSIGYRTMLAGKYLNSEGCDPQPGWTRWVCGTKTDEIDPRLNIDGQSSKFRGYTSQILANYAIQFINADTNPNHPFFLYYAPKDPHLPATDPRGRNLHIPFYNPPSFNVQPNPQTKPKWTQLSPLTGQSLRDSMTNYEKMAQQIPPLDGDIHTILQALGPRANNTLVIYISDNGFLYGEHRLVDKNQPYEESVRVPMAIRYPPLVPAASHFSSSALVENVDIAPTIMDLLGVPWGADGHSIVPLLNRAAPSVRDAVLIEWCTGVHHGQCMAEVGSSRPPPFWGAISERYAYISYNTGEKELYDLSRDPFELTNLAANPADRSVVAQMSATLAALQAEPPPETTIALGPSGRITGTTASFAFFSQDRTTGFRCSLSGPGQNGGDQACNGGTATFPGLHAGAYTFSVRAVASNGRTDPSPATRAFTVSG
jgi:N-acetylglucosamine-6-sulfatase